MEINFATLREIVGFVADLTAIVLFAMKVSQRRRKRCHLSEFLLKPLCKLESWSAVWAFFLFVSFLISTRQQYSSCHAVGALIKGAEPRKTLPRVNAMYQPSLGKMRENMSPFSSARTSKVMVRETGSPVFCQDSSKPA